MRFARSIIRSLPPAILIAAAYILQLPPVRYGPLAETSIAIPLALLMLTSLIWSGVFLWRVIDFDLKWQPQVLSNVSWLMIGLLLIGAAFRLTNLTTDSLWLDELHTELTSRSPAPIAILDSLPPNWSMLYPFIAAVFRVFAGSSALVLRLPATWAGIISIAALYGLGKRLYHHEVGVIAAAVLVPSYFFIKYSQEARSYALLTMFSLLAVWAWLPLYRGLASKKIKLSSLLLFSVFALCALYTDFLAIPLISVLIGVPVLKSLSFPRLTQACLGLGLILATIYVPLIAMVLRRTTELLWLDWIQKPGAIAPALWDYVQTPFNSWIVLIVLLAVFAITVITKYSRGVAAKDPALIPTIGTFSWFVVPFLVLYLVSVTYKPLLVDRYLIAYAAAGFVLAGIGLHYLPLRTHWRQLLSVLVVVFMAVHLIYRYEYYSTPQKSELDRATEYFAKRLANEEHRSTIISVGFRTTRAYYFSVYDLPEPDAIIKIDDTKEMIGKAVDATLDAKPTQTVWFVVYERQIDLSDLDRVTEHSLRLVSSQKFYRASVWEFSITP